jgi:hypothetical protein
MDKRVMAGDRMGYPRDRGYKFYFLCRHRTASDNLNLIDRARGKHHSITRHRRVLFYFID